MRIINVMLARGRGGIEQSFLDYSHALQAMGHEVHSVMHPKAEMLRLLDAPAGHVHTLANWGEWDILAARQLRHVLNGVKPYIAIAHGNRALRLLARAKAHPLVAVMHNYKIKCRYAGAVIAPTRDLLRHAEEQGARREHLHLVPNMVRVPKDMPKRSWQAKPVIGAMGRLVAKKGFEVFIAALAILRARGHEFRAVLGGEGEELERLTSQALRENIGYEVEFCGWVKDKYGFFESLDIFCLPSHHEPFGIVLLEAMAQGLPVVATASEGPCEIIEQSMDGLLVAVGDATEMADSLEELLLDPRRAQLMGRNAYDAVREKFDAKVVAAKLDLALRASAAL